MYSEHLASEEEGCRFSLRSLLLGFAALTFALGGIAWWQHSLGQVEKFDAADKMSCLVACLWHGGKAWESRGIGNPRVDRACDESFCSWRLTIGASPLLIGCLDYVDLDQPWDSGAYAMHRSSAKFHRLQRKNDGKTATRVMAITGPGTAFDAIWRSARKGIVTPPPDAILLVDIARSKHHWMAPGDLDVRSLDPKKANGGLPRSVFEQGRLVAFADGIVWLVSHEAPVAAILKFTTVDGALQHDREDLLRPYVLLEALYEDITYGVEWP